MPRRPPPLVVFVVWWGYPRTGGLTLEAAHQRPCGRKQRAGEIQLDQVAHHERVETCFEGVLEPRVELGREPGKPEEIDDDVAGEHRGDRRGEATVPTLSREEAGQCSREHETDEVAAGRAREHVPAVRLVSVDGCAQSADEDVDPEAGNRKERTERGADEDDGERLARDRHRREGKADRNLRSERNEARAAENEED